MQEGYSFSVAKATLEFLLSLEDVVMCNMMWLYICLSEIKLSKSSLSNIKPIKHWAYKPLSLTTIEPIDNWAYWLSSLSTIEPINHQAYWPSSLSTIKHIDHQAYRPSSQLTIKRINHQAYQPKPFGLLCFLNAALWFYATLWSASKD